MTRFYKHKPYWARPEDWVTRKPSGAKQPDRPVLDAKRSPSGDWIFSGDVYKPDLRDSKIPRVPKGKLTKQWTSMQRMKQTLAKYSTKINFAMAAAEVLGDPDTMRGIMDYGWDDFMAGKAPPPFDFLNRDIPPEWLPTNVPSPGQDLSEYTTAIQLPDGSWMGVTFPYEVPPSPLQNDWTNFNTNTVPPPGTYPGIEITGNGGMTNFGNDIREWPLVDPPPLGWSLGIGPAPGYPLGWRNTQYLYLEGKATLDSAAYRAAQHNLFAGYDGGNPPGQLVPLDLDVDLVRLGPTEESVMSAGGGTRPGWAPIPTPYRWNHPYINLFKEIAGTRVVDIPQPIVGEGGTRTIGVPGGPVIQIPTKPGEPPHPPGNGTKERKRLVGGKLFFFTQKMFQGITEYQDLLDAIFDALPKDLRKQFKMKGPIMKTAFVWSHLDKVDIGDAIVNIAWNQFEDYVIGTQLFGRNKRAAEARGDRYAFRTLNSANDYGGLEALGEAYGEFSKEYVNPKKEDLKRFLTERFGI